MPEDITGDPRRKLLVEEGLRLVKSHSGLNKGTLFTPPQKHSKQLSSLPNASESQYQSWFNTHSSPSHGYRTAIEDLYCDEREFDSFDDDLPDFDSEVVNNADLSSSCWSPPYAQHSSRTSIRSDSFPPQGRLPGVCFYKTESSSQSNSLNCNGDPSEIAMEQLLEERGDLPSFITLDFNGRRSSSTVYGSLFEHEDPWSTIGVILRLPQRNDASEDIAMDKRDTGIDCDNTLNLEEQTSVSEAHYDEKWESNDNSDDYHDVDMGSVVCSKSKQEQVQDRIMQDVSPMEEILLCRKWNGGGLIPDRIVSLPKFSGTDEEKALQLVQGVNSGRDEATDGFTDSEASPKPIQESVMELDVDETLEQIFDGGGGKILDTPELREVNGRFLGPSLFDTFESESESVD